LRYQSDHLLDDVFQRWASQIVAEHVYARRIRDAGLDLSAAKVNSIFTRVSIDAKELSQMKDGRIEEARDENKAFQVMVPFGLLMLMFLVVMVGATPLMQGVVEEKMQRIAEVLLGSVRPFHLMLGKLIGTVGVSLTLVLFYLGGAYYAAQKYGISDRLPTDVLAWFVVYQVMAVTMYGSLFIAVGAACTDMKETQSLMWPVMVLAMLPLFVAFIVIKEPNSTFATWASLFPPATPMLMIARQAVPPGISIWQPALGVLLVLVTTLLCVYAAGRIFRVGILMQGKGARIGEMLRWVIRG
jgi:ABC-2 type transport system permease protein